MVVTMKGVCGLPVPQCAPRLRVDDLKISKTRLSSHFRTTK